MMVVIAVVVRSDMVASMLIVEQVSSRVSMSA